jgi:hypothetical protein
MCDGVSISEMASKETHHLGWKKAFISNLLELSGLVIPGRQKEQETLRAKSISYNCKFVAGIVLQL